MRSASNVRSKVGAAAGESSAIHAGMGMARWDAEIDIAPPQRRMPYAAIPQSPMRAEVAARNARRLRAVLAGTLGIAPELVTDRLARHSIAQWDSVAHMAFVTQMESLFEIMLDTEDIAAMKSYGEIRRILRGYGVDVSD